MQLLGRTISLSPERRQLLRLTSERAESAVANQDLLRTLPLAVSLTDYFFRYFAGTSPASIRALMQNLLKPLRLLSKQLRS